MALGPHLSHVHPNHPLNHYFDDGDYICHGCRTVGFGARFKCQACPVNIHVFCSDCPRELSCFFHSHRLLLVAQPQAPNYLAQRHWNCDICREPINGLFYRCNDCDFDVHPVCTQFPRELRHTIDNHHSLRLQKVAYGSCDVCGNDCSSHWVYGCGVCRVNIHLQCLRRQYDSGGSSRSLRMIPNAPSRWTTTGQQQHAFHAPAAHPYYHHAPPAQFPNFHFWYPGPAYLPPAPVPFYPYQYNHGHPHGNSPPPQPPLGWGSLFLETVFSLVANLAAGSISDFIFGSLGF